MKVTGLDLPLADIDGEPLMRRIDGDELAEAMLKFGIPKGDMREVLNLIASKVDEEKVKRDPWTGALVIKTALQYADDKTSFDKRADRVGLAFRVMQSPAEVEIDKSELEDLQDCIAKTFPHPVMAYRMKEIFDAAKAAAKAPKQTAGAAA